MVETTILSAAAVTETMHISVRPLWEVAVMVALPMPTAVSLPASTVTMSSALLRQVKSVTLW